MKKLAFGVDIGGINTAFGLVDEKGDLFGESVISTRAYPNYQDYPRYVADLCEAMKLLVAAVNFEFELIGIGVGAPNANFYKGKCCVDTTDVNTKCQFFHIKVCSIN